MIQGKSVLAIIPARGGSKGLPGKNTIDLGGKPLIAWTIEEAKKSQYIDRCILSSDDPDIIEVAKKWNCEVPFVRPPELAGDDSSVVDTVLHAIEQISDRFYYTVLLQPTSPLRRAEDIDYCLERCMETGCPSCVSITEPHESPHWMFEMACDGKLIQLMKDRIKYQHRQDLPPVFVLNGAVYVSETEWFSRNKCFVGTKTRGYVMPKERSVDIDTEIDMRFCQVLISENQD